MGDVFLLVEDDSTYNFMIDKMFFDAKNTYGMRTCVEPKSQNLIVNMLKNLRFKKITQGYFDIFLVNSFELQQELIDATKENGKVYVIFLNSSFLESRYPTSVLKKYKAISNKIIYILLYIDIVSHPCSRHANILRNAGIFDYIYTVDKSDAKQYNLQLCLTPYSKDKDYEQIEIDYDMYFCAVTKDRLPKIRKILTLARQNDVAYKMDIIKTPLDDAEILEEFKPEVTVYPAETYRKYNDVLRDTLRARCILEIVQENQAALTLRPYEAVVYNRKLLTNNKNILEFPYWNPDYMQYFEKVEDIDWEWVKADEKVDYGYNGEFSPINLIEDICKRMNGENQ